MDCLIYQPLGLGDILWVQGIVDHYLERGYRVIYPVSPIYYDIVSKYINKDGLEWYRDDQDYPLKDFTSSSRSVYLEDKVYVAVQFADQYINGSLMLSKYAYAEVTLPQDYREHFEIQRDYTREQKLIDVYGLHGDYVLVNETFATKPTTIRREIALDTQLPVHYMNIQQDEDNGFHLFDWIGALQNAKSFHSVGTSVCYIADKYCNNDMHIYERRTLSQPRTMHIEIQNVYKNPRWVYED